MAGISMAAIRGSRASAIATNHGPISGPMPSRRGASFATSPSSSISMAVPSRPTSPILAYRPSIWTDSLPAIAIKTGVSIPSPIATSVTTSSSPTTSSSTPGPRAHDGRHWGEVISGNGLPPGTEPDHTYYDYHPRTVAGGLFLREEWQLRPELLVTGDMAWRHQSYFMRGDRPDALFHLFPVRFDQ